VLVTYGPTHPKKIKKRNPRSEIIGAGLVVKNFEL